MAPQTTWSGSSESSPGAAAAGMAMAEIKAEPLQVSECRTYPIVPLQVPGLSYLSSLNWLLEIAPNLYARRIVRWTELASDV